MPNSTTLMANRYGLNFKLYDSADTSLTTSLLDIDFINVSSLELASDRVWATGEQDHSNQIGFNNPIVGTLTLSTQIMTQALLHVIAGGMAGQGTNTVVFKRLAEQAVRTYIITADTLWQDRTGTAYSESITIWKASPRIAYNIAYTGDGEPANMDIVFDIIQDTNEKVVTIGKNEMPACATPTLSLNQGRMYLTPADNITTNFNIYVDDMYIGSVPR